MTPLVKRNVETLVDICGEKAETGESFDFYKSVQTEICTKSDVVAQSGLAIYTTMHAFSSHVHIH